MKIAVKGTGYVGLVTGVCLADIGHHVTCIDIDESKIELLQLGQSPIYEPGLEELMKKNMEAGCLSFTANYQDVYASADVIFIAVGTPEREDGSANLTYVEQAAQDIATSLQHDTIVVTKSTVPVGTNDRVRAILHEYKPANVKVEVASNPEFLREGSAIYDTFHGDRIVIGADTPHVADQVASIFEPLGLPIVKSDIRSAEMIKYAANAFLATKISFINEIANICEKVGANIEDVANGIGQDSRIGNQFLRAGIGYGGSCFPKDTKALVQIAGNVQHKFELLESVIRVNNAQQALLFKKAVEIVGSFEGKKVAVLGLAFKPNTDDIREAASFVLIGKLVDAGAHVVVYDPIAMEKARVVLGSRVSYAGDVESCVREAEATFLVTEWDEIRSIPLSWYIDWMNTPLLLDGRNCYTLEDADALPIQYVSIGRRQAGSLLVDNKI
ncbi:UDP-glucose dehydrogenase family protein [Bacillus salinus]|uniref:UDP-glucose dehydrogenase family protein n=1 Tax=Bacillus sp. HMF5848 TaxID=2495421 RepID=UPI00163AFCCF